MFIRLTWLGSVGKHIFWKIEARNERAKAELWITWSFLWDQARRQPFSLLSTGSSIKLKSQLISIFFQRLFKQNSIENVGKSLSHKSHLNLISKKYSFILYNFEKNKTCDSIFLLRKTCNHLLKNKKGIIFYFELIKNAFCSFLLVTKQHL